MTHHENGTWGDETPPVPDGGKVSSMLDAPPEGYVPWVQEAKQQDGILTMIGHEYDEGDLLYFDTVRPWYVRLWRRITRKKPKVFEIIAVTGSTVIFKEHE